jgi:hypothetical protein
MTVINIPAPELQIDFSFILGQVRSIYLQDALRKTIDSIDISKLDRELSKYVPKASLRGLAKHGLRGELLYAVPYLLEENPYLLGYYRLLLGFSQKEFYTVKFGISRFKLMESKGSLSENNKSELPELCKGLIKSTNALVDGIGIDRLSKDIIDDLTILTLGPQLRGGANVKRGAAGIIDVFQSIHEIVEHAIIDASASKIEIRNAAARRVLIEFASDPDIVIREEMSHKKFRNIIAIEIKSGTDFSNIHNRVGEAEKSHQKAKAAGYVECWTVVNVDRINMAMAKQESPTTNKFYRLSDIKRPDTTEYQDFKVRILSLTGIPHRSAE